MSNARDSLHSSQSARRISERKTRSRNRGNVQYIGTRDQDAPANHVELTSSEQVLNSECEAFTESHAGKTNVLLLTGTARIQHPKTKATQEVQILLDTGADNSFIQKHLADELELPTLRTSELLMYTFGSKKPKPCTFGVTSVRLWDNHDQPLDLTLFKTDTISGKGKQVVLDEWDREYLAKEHIDLPNPDGSIIRPKILLGCDQLWNLIKFPCKGHVLPSGLHIIPSRLGYLLTGKSALKEEKASSGTCNFSESDCDISFETEDETDKWDRYWTIDSTGIEEFTGPTKVERAAVAKRVHHDFNATIERRSDGYYVRLPFKDNRDSLPTNYKLAQRRLSSVLQKLREKPELLEQYNAVFEEQLEKGVIEKVTSKEQLGLGHVHYLPHRAVPTPKKETAKLRIVFDAASHYKDCPALNEVLHQGPTLLPDLYAVLLRFRLEPYVATADVEKAFLQIRLHEDGRDVTRFLGVRDLTLPPENDNLVCFRSTRVPFGLNASSFLLGGTIQFHLQNSVSDHALAQQIQHNLYVDNLVLGAETPEELGHKSEAVRAIFCDMKLNLREFLSNTEHVTSVIPRDKCAKTESQKVLGILWHSKQDSLQISCNFPNKTFITKRTVTQQIASIYDPLGWLVPIMVLPKQFQQNLWRHDYAWDQKLSQPHQDQWEKILQAINGIDIEIKRHIPICEANQLALFSDASENAMAACAYLVSKNSSSLLMAKSKLPSIKTRITIPKVEMNALAIAGRLALSILNALLAKVHTIRRVLFFSDSQIVLGWTKKGPHERDLGKLVTNRIKELQNIVTTIRSMGLEVAFGYVPSESNPADAGTRGLSREQFLDHYWWTGPNFLRNPNGDWTQSLFTIESPATANETLAFTVVSENKSQIFPWHRHSSYIKAQRTMAWVLRFLRAFTKHLQPEHQLRVYTALPLLKSDAQTDEKALTGAEMRQSKMVLIRLHQANFSEDYIKSMDNTLKLFKDSMGLWRVRGRLGSTTLEDSAKFLILISPKSEIADIILRDAHGKFHSGIAHTMSTVRQEYWIPRLRQKTRNLIQHCVRCRRFNAAPYFYPAMPDLPARRVQQSAPFQHIGLDFFDLPKVRDGSSLVKVYGCIFTCAVTRLIHLEVVTNMGTIAFFNTLRRFFSRRGIPSSITCDNAPTFILCEEILGAAIQNAESNPLIANNNIDWKHITPYAPWQGGFYERLIQTVKRSLYKALGRALLDLDTLTTVITEVEASLNTRPLTYQEAEPENLKPLRPIDFIQKNMTITYPLDTITVDTSDPDYHPLALAHALQTRKQAEEALQSSYAVTQKTWEIWHNSYLLSLREQHRKWIAAMRKNSAKPQVGAVALVADPLLSRNEWKLARIVETRAGDDGEVREVGLITATGTKIDRPVNLVVPLELDCEYDDTHLRKLRAQTAEEAINTATPCLRRSENERYDLRERKQVSYRE
uniref:DUF1758 domain-containing protein n=1 Tax=Haemonchus contortus TaxID=6289 RepID=A0A7I4YSW8_HAECO